jgi:predicted GNAT family acetyltransferase
VSEDGVEVLHEPERSRWALKDGERVIGMERYVDHGEQRIFFHTEVAKEHGGRGLAGRLVRAAVEDAVASGSAVVPVCPYVTKWLERHPEHATHVVAPTPEHHDRVRAHLS